jgi:outer membrane immunogenic protein
MSNMLRLSVLVAAASLCAAVAQSASAADLPLPTKEPVIAPAFSWTGFYIGANVGAGFGTTESTLNIAPPNAIINALAGPGVPPINVNLPLVSQSTNGFLGGGQLGYNWQAGIFVFGLEGDFDGAGLQGTAPCVLVFACTVKHNWEADITGRVGVVAIDRTLLYLKGGVAWEQSNYSLGNSITVGGAGGGTASLNASASATRTGGLLGMGIEYKFLNHWSAKLEYNFMDFGNQTLNFPIAVGVTGVAIPPAINAALAGGVPVTIREYQNIIKAGVNYEF